MPFSIEKIIDWRGEGPGAGQLTLQSEARLHRDSPARPSDRATIRPVIMQCIYHKVMESSSCFLRLDWWGGPRRESRGRGKGLVGEEEIGRASCRKECRCGGAQYDRDN